MRQVAFWAEEIARPGHAVRLMASQYVKPYVKRQKNDRADAEAICEAVERSSMRFVAVKNEERQSTLAIYSMSRKLTRHQPLRRRWMKLSAFGVVKMLWAAAPSAKSAKRCVKTKRAGGNSTGVPP